MTPSPPNPQSQNETSQECNGASTVLITALGEETIIISSTVFSDLVIAAPVIKPPSRSPFTLHIYVTPPLPPTYPPHVPLTLPPPLPLEPLPLIAPPPYPSYYVADKYNDVVAQLYQKK